ncbi:ComEC/Rec2 family competence protein, partial [Frankia sp. Cpl3]|nr:ComEC/Rec2 family competence protein [Frankia sp. Cpl3]
HVLAISGLHVTLVSGLFLWLLERIGLVREKALIITMAMIVCYVLLVGASASAIRSGMMGIMMLTGHYLRKHLSVYTIWAAALLLMLLYNPYQLW